MSVKDMSFIRDIETSFSKERKDSEKGWNKG